MKLIYSKLWEKTIDRSYESVCTSIESCDGPQLTAIPTENTIAGPYTYNATIHEIL